MGGSGWMLVTGGWLLAGLLLWSRPQAARPRRVTRRHRHVPRSDHILSDSRD